MAICAKEAYRSDAFLLGALITTGAANLVGPATAAIASTIEPVVTVVLAMAFFDERLRPVQVVGGILALTAVILLAAKVRRSVPSIEPTAAAAAGAIASEPARG
jgi:hypothetical protein